MLFTASFGESATRVTLRDRPMSQPLVNVVIIAANAMSPMCRLPHLKALEADVIERVAPKIMCELLMGYGM
jgi:hypothetical protein